MWRPPAITWQNTEGDSIKENEEIFSLQPDRIYVVRQNYLYKLDGNRTSGKYGRKFEGLLNDDTGDFYGFVHSTSEFPAVFC